MEWVLYTQMKWGREVAGDHVLDQCLIRSSNNYKLQRPAGTWHVSLVRLPLKPPHDFVKFFAGFALTVSPNKNKILSYLLFIKLNRMVNIGDCMHTFCTSPWCFLFFCFFFKKTKKKKKKNLWWVSCHQGLLE